MTQPHGWPRWAKVSLIVLAVLITLGVAVMLAAGGPGHQIPSHGGS